MASHTTASAVDAGTGPLWGDPMSIVDKVKEFLGQHGAQVDKAVDKAGDMIDERTGGKYADKVDKAQDQAKKTAAQWGEEGRLEPPPQP